MFYISLRDIDEKITQKLQMEYESYGGISIRGNTTSVGSTKVILPSELFGRTTLPINLLANKYCPTNRDIYLEKVKGIPGEQTWSRYKGKVIHELYFLLFDAAKRYISKRGIIEKADLHRYISRNGSLYVNKIKKEMGSRINQFLKKPSESEKQKFIKGLYKIIRFESKVGGCLIDHSIATNVDITLETEFDKLFPFLREKIIRAPLLGFSEKGVKPDFMYKGIIVGDIKTGKIEEFHKLTIAAYALGYEHHYDEKVNFGIILNVDFSEKRNVPIYRDTNFFVIRDKYRRAFLDLRNKKFEIIISGKDPGKPERAKCNKECLFYKNCWDENE